MMLTVGRAEGLHPAGSPVGCVLSRVRGQVIVAPTPAAVAVWTLRAAAVVLRYLCDQTDDEIAEALDCSTATVRSHLSHARAALRLAAANEEMA